MQKLFRDLKRARRLESGLSGELTILQLEVESRTASADGSDADFIEQTMTKIENARNLILERRRKYKEDEQRLTDLMTRAVKARDATKELVNRKAMAEIESAIIAFDFTLLDRQVSDEVEQIIQDDKS